ncbi:MAG: hypothetical protein IIA77_00070 [Proteobacteria bacterium]|nr:hypothetical protein [Pseudomonadota bacterium]
MSQSKKIKEYVIHLFAHPKYERILDKIHDKYIDEGKPDYLAVPYILMCSITLEARLNDELHNHATTVWKDDFTTIANSYMSMSFRSKLNSLVPILTENKFRINQDHFVYQRLASLITIRNKLAHPKTTIEKFKAEEPDKKGFPFLVGLPPEYFEKVDDLTLGTKDAFTPLEYHEALEKLEKWFFRRCPDGLSKVEMVIANENS